MRRHVNVLVTLFMFLVLMDVRFLIFQQFGSIPVNYRAVSFKRNINQSMNDSTFDNVRYLRSPEQPVPYQNMGNERIHGIEKVVLLHTKTLPERLSMVLHQI